MYIKNLSQLIVGDREVNTPLSPLYRLFIIKMKPEEKKYLVDQKIRQGKTKLEANLDIERDEESIKNVGIIIRIKNMFMKKDPKQINKSFKEGNGSLR